MDTGAADLQYILQWEMNVSSGLDFSDRGSRWKPNSANTDVFFLKQDLVVSFQIPSTSSSELCAVRHASVMRAGAGEACSNP